MPLHPGAMLGEGFWETGMFSEDGICEKTSSCLIGRMSILFSQLIGETRKEPWCYCERLRVGDAHSRECTASPGAS